MKNTQTIIKNILKGCSGNQELYENYMNQNLWRIEADFQFLKNEIPNIKSLLDIGAIPPLLTSLFAINSNIKEITIIDRHVDLFQDYFHQAGINYRHGDIISGYIEPVETCFDLVCLCEVIEHLTGNILLTMQKIANYVAPDGYLYITTPNIRSLTGALAIFGSHQSGLASKHTESLYQQYEDTYINGYYGHVREYTAKEVIDLIENFGFSHIKSCFQTRPISKVTGKYNKIITALENVFVNYRLMGKHLFKKDSQRVSYAIPSENYKQKISYSLPTYLISYPRSGSNFLQSVLSKSSGLCCKSIYALPHNYSEHILSLKSHAISYKYLLDESKRLVHTDNLPSKIILLFRDPRDVMISFYEFVLKRKNTKISQKEFLENVCYFYATYEGKDTSPLERQVEYSPLNVAEGYIKHIYNWFVKKPENLDCLVVKFEDLILSPYTEFKRIFDFLELDCSLATEQLKVKVSQYSDSKRQRGKAYEWVNCQDEYSKLLNRVNTLFHSEIKILGYDKKIITN